MYRYLSRAASVVTLSACLGSVLAADQTSMGAGNVAAGRIVAKSPRVREAHAFLYTNALRIKDRALREATLDLLSDQDFCVTSRVDMDEAAELRIVEELLAAGLLNGDDESTFPGGLKAGVFPPVRAPKSRCPGLPMPFDAAPGSAFTSHHGYPGGLPIHEANNLRSDLGLAETYRASYRAPRGYDSRDEEGANEHGRSFYIDQDVIIAAPIWHDWARTMVFQWTADGQEFLELNIGGTPANGSATGGHHIISIAESIKRRLPPVFVIAQASAHSSPTLGNEFKVVNWIRAAAIIAQVDPVAAGYLAKDAVGFHLPPLRKLDNGVDLVAAGQTNLLVEYALHNLSDADFTFSIPAAADANLLLGKLAPRYGFDPGDGATFNNRFRNPVLANATEERLSILFGNGGLRAVQSELDALRSQGIF